MEYPVVIEYILGTENTIADILSRLSGHAIDDAVSSALASGIPSYACPVCDADRLDIRTHLYAEQRADATISPVIQLLKNGNSPSANDL